jgi:serine/threonine protein kinase
MEDRPMTPRSDGFCRSKKNQDPLLYKKYFSKYRTIKKLGEGSFGKVYKAEYNNEYFAIKFEDKAKGQNLLETEATIMSYLKGPNIPQIKSFGYSGDYNILVMQLLGRSLEELFNKKQKFSTKTTALLAYQMITVLQYIHDKHIIHRDIKPDNFVMGINKQNAVLYLLDFGLAKKYRSSKTLEQYPYIKKKKLTGTARYASIHALEEMEQSRRDDLESVGYVLMYFLRGGLPWQGLKIKSKEDRYKKILDKKKETSSEQLCKGFPEEFKDFLEYAKNLEYTEEPKYEKYKNKFYNLVTNKLEENFD